MQAKLLSAAVIEVVRGTPADVAEFPAALRVLDSLEASRTETSILVAKSRSQAVGVLLLAHPAERLVTCGWPNAGNFIATRSLLESIPTALDSKTWSSQFVLLPCANDRHRALLESLGWGRAGEVASLICSTKRLSFDSTASPDVELFDSDALDEQTLISLLEETMQGSLDWPEFRPFTMWSQQLARYRADSEFDPSCWRVLCLRGTPVGIAISAPRPSRNRLTLTYLGVVPSARGEGMGGILLRDLLRLARERSIAQVQTNVDAANHYATALYKQHQFKILSRVPLWFREFLTR